MPNAPVVCRGSELLYDCCERAHGRISVQAVGATDRWHGQEYLPMGWLYRIGIPLFFSRFIRHTSAFSVRALKLRNGVDNYSVGFWVIGGPCYAAEC